MSLDDLGKVVVVLEQGTWVVWDGSERIELREAIAELEARQAQRPLEFGEREVLRFLHGHVPKGWG